MLLWRLEIFMVHMGRPEVIWTTPLWWLGRRHRFVPSLHGLTISGIFLYVARPVADANNKRSANVVRSLSVVILPCLWLACGLVRIYIFIWSRDFGCMTLLENSCCLVAFRVWIRDIHRLLMDSPFLLLIFRCTSVVLIPVFASACPCLFW